MSTYAIAATINGQRRYWRKKQPGTAAGCYTHFEFATRYSADERAKTKLPADGMWVSVLHGMGADYAYPALSVLADASVIPMLQGGRITSESNDEHQ